MTAPIPHYTGWPREFERAEFGQLMAGGGFHTMNDAPEIEAIYPLADQIRAGRRFGGHVYRRRIVVIEDWTEVDDQGEPCQPSE